MDATGEENRTCSNCGVELDATANFCPSCGAAQTPEPEVPEGPPPPIPEPGRIEAAEVPGVPPPPQGAAPSPGRGPLTFVGIGCGAILLMFLLLAGCLALFSGPSEESASVETTEESVEEEPAEEPTEESEPSVPEDFTPEDTRPTPRTPEERVRRNIEDALDPIPGDEYNDLQELQITSRANGCLDTYVAFEESSGFLRDWDAGGIEYQMRQVYEGAYSDDELRRWVCTVRASASGVLTDDRGNERTETLHTTSMSGEVADTVNWNNVYDVNFPSIWTVEYIHPELERQEAQDTFDQARDCLDDGGLFDFDWAECP